MALFTETPLSWAYIFEPKIFWDDRWFFMETWSAKGFEDKWIFINRVQDNHSKSNKWVLRWLHFQTKKHQDKLVRVVTWSVYDVIVDCRIWSETYGDWYGIVLSAENKKQLLVPKWFAHWFLCLEDNTEFLYKVSDVYDPGGEWWVTWNDEELWIDWQTYFDEYGIETPILSEKDIAYQPRDELPEYFLYQS